MLTTPFHNLKFAEKHWATTKPNEDKNNTWAYFSTFAKTHSGPASAAVPDLLSSKSPSMHRSHPWSHAWPPCFLEEWRCSWRSHFGSSNCSTSRRPAPTAPPEGGSLNGPWRQMMFDQNWPSCVTKLDYWESQEWQHIKMHWSNLGFLHWCPPQANLVASGTPCGVKDMMSSTESKKPEFRGATPSQSYFLAKYQSRFKNHELYKLYRIFMDYHESTLMFTWNLVELAPTTQQVARSKNPAWLRFGKKNTPFVVIP